MTTVPSLLALAMSASLLCVPVAFSAEEAPPTSSAEARTDTAKDRLAIAEQQRQQWRKRLARSQDDQQDAEESDGRRGGEGRQRADRPAAADGESDGRRGGERGGEGRQRADRQGGEAGVGRRGAGQDRQRLSDEERAERLANHLAARFALLDTDESGTISLQEKLAAPHPRADSDNPPTDEQLERWKQARAELVPIVFALVDSDGDGEISLEEYLAHPQAPMQARALQRFHGADADGDGVLNPEEWQAALSNRRARQGQESEAEPAQRRRGPDPAVMFDRFDTNNDGVIDQQEFIEAMEAMRRHRGQRRRGRQPAQEAEG
ncbi:MAG: hypothetical protein EA401_07070 [Planctomycetota bacterium]|nr:MAG: hypothetical protein EA401_07070 [Planctomycetota bacterium]